MSTFDQVIIDDRDLVNRYFGDTNFDDDQFGLPNFQSNNQRTLGPRTNLTTDFRAKNNDNSGLLGRRVFLESPSFGNRDEEDIYRFVPSRLSDNPASLPAPNAETLIDSLDFELNVLGANHLAQPISYQSNSKFTENSRAPLPLTQIKNPTIEKTNESNLIRSDPRQDPLLGPLLAELDVLSNQQRKIEAQNTAPLVRRNSLPRAGNLNRPTSYFSQPDQALPATAHRTATDALLDSELYDSLETRDTRKPNFQQRQPIPYSAPNLNSNSQQVQHQTSLLPRTSNMNGTDIFFPSAYDTGPGSFLSNFGTDDQLFQQPLLNAIGQNYVSNPRQQQISQQPNPNYEQRDQSFDNSYSKNSLPQRNNYPPVRQQDNFQRQPAVPATNQRQTPYSNHADPFEEYPDQYPPTNSRFQPSQTQRTAAPSVNSIPQRTATQQQPYETPKPINSYPSTNRELFFTDHDDDQLEQVSYRPQQAAPSTGANSQRNSDQNEQDSKRQAIWDELQKNNAKVQEKNAKKRESANRREQMLKGNFTGAQQSSAPTKPTNNPPVPRRPPPMPVPRTNYIEDNIDMIKNKENYYHRYPAKKYENLFSKRKDLSTGGKPNQKKNDDNNDQDVDEYGNPAQPAIYVNSDEHGSNPNNRSSLPVTINLNPGQASQTGALPATVTIPLDSHVNRVGDKISVNIDLRLVDLQNLKKQQAGEQPDWTGLDPLDRHIRKLERSIDQTLPPTELPIQRSSSLSNPAVGTSMGRYGKMTTGAGGGSGSYHPPSYNGDYHNYSDKVQDENSYLAKMTQSKRPTNFKPYDGRDYNKFKKDHGVGAGFLGFDFDNPTYKEKSDKLVKTKEYAQVVEARNKKKLAEAPRRTLSDTRIPTESSKNQRALDYARVATQHKQSSGSGTRATPPDTNEPKGNGEAGRRPTEVAQRPPPVRKTNKSPPNDNDLVERLALRHEQEKAQVQGILNPSQRRRDPQFDDDRGITDIERLAQDRAQQRRISPVKPLPPPGPNPGANGRRPLRFDKSSPDEAPISSTGPSYNGPPQPYANHRPPPISSSDSQPYSNHRPPPISSSDPQPYSNHRPPPISSTDSQARRERDRPVNHRSQSPPTQHQGNRPGPRRAAPPPDDNVDELANRHHDEKMLMEAIRMELSERPLADDEELIVIQE